jgi:hypothetical protein
MLGQRNAIAGSAEPPTKAKQGKREPKTTRETDQPATRPHNFNRRYPCRGAGDSGKMFKIKRNIAGRMEASLRVPRQRRTMRSNAGETV